MIYFFKIIIHILFFVATIRNCASEKNVVISRLDPDSLIRTLSKTDSLKDAIHLAATDKYHYNTFYNAIIADNIMLNRSLLFIKDNEALCTKMLISCALMCDNVDPEKNKADKETYRQRFHSLWRYSSEHRDNQVREMMGDFYLEKSPDLSKQIKISLYAGTCFSLGVLRNALSVCMDNREHDILETLIKRNIIEIQALKDFQGYKTDYMHVMYNRFGVNFIKKLIAWGVNLKDYRYDDIPLGQSLIRWAHDKSDEEMIIFLLDQGVRNTLDFERSSQHNGILETLHYPKFVSLNILRLLLQRNYFNQQIKNELLCKHVEHEHTKIFDLLLEHGAEKSSLSVEDLCLKGYFDELRSLIQKDSTVFQKMHAWRIRRCFEYALHLIDLDVLAFLCIQPDININHDFGSEGGVLFLALDKGKFNGAKVLVQRGADIHEKKIEQRYTDNKWNSETVDFLLKNGFNAAQVKKSQIKECVKNLPRNFLEVTVLGMILMGFSVSVAGFITILINGVAATWNGTGVA